MASSLVVGVAGTRESPRARKVAAYLELTKPRVTVLILLISIASFWMGSKGAPEGRPMLEMAAGIILLAGGIFALNQYLEQDLDARMRRTESRPLPTGKVSPGEALWFGVGLSIAAVAVLFVMVNALSAVLAVLTLGSYLFLYTPLKTRSPHCTSVGAFPGAAPPLLGWAAARGELGAEAWVLFVILFLWQFPHFHAIGLLYREDYARADIRILAVVEPAGRALGWQIVGAALLLLPVSLLPAMAGVAGSIYFCGAAALGVAFLGFSLRLEAVRSKARARLLLLASVLYLPALFALMVIDRR
jgi:protoheme IX farnesyltransferase